MDWLVAGAICLIALWVGVLARGPHALRKVSHAEAIDPGMALWKRLYG